VSLSLSLRAQTKYRVYRARKFMAAVRSVRDNFKLLNKMATRMQAVFRGLRGRQLFEVAKNMREMRALTDPLQRTVKKLEDEEEEVRTSYLQIERRIELQEVCVCLCVSVCVVSFFVRPLRPRPFFLSPSLSLSVALTLSRSHSHSFSLAPSLAFPLSPRSLSAPRSVIPARCCRNRCIGW
jgi:hypothetical protein